MQNSTVFCMSKYKYVGNIRNISQSVVCLHFRSATVSSRCHVWVSRRTSTAAPSNVVVIPCFFLMKSPSHRQLESTCCARDLNGLIAATSCTSSRCASSVRALRLGTLSWTRRGNEINCRHGGSGWPQPLTFVEYMLIHLYAFLLVSAWDPCFLCTSISGRSRCPKWCLGQCKMILVSGRLRAMCIVSPWHWGVLHSHKECSDGSNLIRLDHLKTEHLVAGAHCFLAETSIAAGTMITGFYNQDMHDFVFCGTRSSMFSACQLLYILHLSSRPNDYPTKIQYQSLQQNWGAIATQDDGPKIWSTGHVTNHYGAIAVVKMLVECRNITRKSLNQ